MDGLDGLFEHELKELYDAEKRLVKALEQQASEVADEEVSAAFEEHRGQTERQVERLERVFAAIGVEPEARTCHGIVGLLREREELLKEDPAAPALHVLTLGAAAKVELYEIAAYESLVRLATLLDLDDEVAGLLLESLEDEAPRAEAEAEGAPAR